MIYRILDRFHPWDKERWVYSNDKCFDSIEYFISWVNQHGGFHSEVIAVGDFEYQAEVMKLLDKRRKDYEITPGIYRGATPEEGCSHYVNYQNKVMKWVVDKNINFHMKEEKKDMTNNLTKVCPNCEGQGYTVLFEHTASEQDCVCSQCKGTGSVTVPKAFYVNRQSFEIEEVYITKMFITAATIVDSRGKDNMVPLEDLFLDRNLAHQQAVYILNGAIKYYRDQMKEGNEKIASLEARVSQLIDEWFIERNES